MPSTVIASVQYEPSTSELTIRFISGSVYRYLDVPQTIYDEFVSSRAKGVYYNREIKNRYRHERVTGNQPQ